MSYMTVATRGGSDADRRFIADAKAGLALATCKDYLRAGLGKGKEVCFEAVQVLNLLG